MHITHKKNIQITTNKQHHMSHTAAVIHTHKTFSSYSHDRHIRYNFFLHIMHHQTGFSLYEFTMITSYGTRRPISGPVWLLHTYDVAFITSWLLIYTALYASCCFRIQSLCNGC